MVFIQSCKITIFVSNNSCRSLFILHKSKFSKALSTLNFFKTHQLIQRRIFLTLIFFFTFIGRIKIFIDIYSYNSLKNNIKFFCYLIHIKHYFRCIKKFILHYMTALKMNLWIPIHNVMKKKW